MITPNILRLGNEEKVLLEAHDYGGNLAVTVSVYDFPAKKQRMFSETIALIRETDHMGTVNINVCAPAGAPPTCLSLLPVLSSSHFGAPPLSENSPSISFFYPEPLALSPSPK